MCFSHDSTGWVSIPMYPISKLCLLILSASHSSALIISGATRSNPVALPRFFKQMCHVNRSFVSRVL